jgi:hypothetical protein
LTEPAKPRAKRDEGVRLIVVVRILQALIIVALWLVTSHFGRSCSYFDPSGIHAHSAADVRSEAASNGRQH